MVHADRRVVGEALEAVNQLQGRGDVVAAFVADQRMPSMTGTEFLAEARQGIRGVIGKELVSIG